MSGSALAGIDQALISVAKLPRLREAIALVRIDARLRRGLPVTTKQRAI